METRFKTVLLLGLVAFICGAAYGQTQDTSPVLIEFDENSERIDLVTGEQVPDYTTVQRGSMQFYLDRLDTPDDFFNFYHDGVRQADPGTLRFIRKLDSRYDIWRFRYKSGGKNTPRIHHKAVSFIPLDDSGKPGNRVYVLLNDLSYIEWGENPK